MAPRLRRAVHRLARTGRRAAWEMARRLENMERSTLDARSRALDQRVAMQEVMRGHDMVDQPDEAYYRDRYWRWIETELAGVDLSKRFLDVGCGSGRLTLPLAAKLAPHGGSVLGMDYLGEAITALERNVQKAGLSNVVAMDGDALELLERQEDGAFAAALFLEAGFTMPHLDAVLAELARALEPRGLLLASFRTRLYLVQYGVKTRNWPLVETVMSTEGGQVPGLDWQNWGGADDTERTLESAGFGEVKLFGVGAVSGVAEDPFAGLVRPSTLDGEELETLARVEDAFGRSHPDIGRYVLASARLSP